eukprot:SM000102S09194  [mRNA]  locus=s102:156775:158176:- [translate_table: standard]
MVLVAPALTAPLRRTQSEEERDRRASQSPSFDWRNPLRSAALAVGWLLGRARAFFRAVARAVKRQLRRLAVAFLGSRPGLVLVRMAMNRFGLAGVRNAWHDPAGVDPDVIEGYTKPLRCRDWDTALMEYVSASFSGSTDAEKPVRQRLHEITCPVLVLTGASDRLVPVWNSRRLAEALPRGCFKVIEKCGHVPHEERPDEFVAAVEEFVADVLSGSFSVTRDGDSGLQHGDWMMPQMA